MYRAIQMLKSDNSLIGKQMQHTVMKGKMLK